MRDPARGRPATVDPGSAGPLPPFTVARLPHLEFGPGRFAQVADIVAGYGGRALLVTGRRSFRETSAWARLLDELAGRDVAHDELAVAGEPSPGLVDEAVARFRQRAPAVVVGIGGGSVLDTAKAVAGLLGPGNSVRDHLEGVGPQLPYRGPAVPFVAVPTTAGTGSEATKNAVLSEAGPAGFKKSFRDERLVAAVAIVDPDLLAGCPPSLIAAEGMDALTQLLEAYVSSNASPFTDALATSGLASVRDGLLTWHRAAASGDGAADDDGPVAAARSRMAYAAHISGVCLAQAGLGAAHGLASPLGAFFPIPHGIACGATIAAASRANIAALEARAPADHTALGRYSAAGRILAGRPDLEAAAARGALLEVLEAWTAELAVPGLAAFGVGLVDVDRLVASARGSSMRTNPIELTDEEIGRILEASR